MNAKTPKSDQNGMPAERSDRLKAALKANLQRRKAQGRARAAQQADTGKNKKG